MALEMLCGVYLPIKRCHHQPSLLSAAVAVESKAAVAVVLGETKVAAGARLVGRGKEE